MTPAFLGGGNERRGQFFVEKEEVFDAFPVVLERLRAVAEGNGAIQRSVGEGDAAGGQRGTHRGFRTSLGRGDPCTQC